LPVSDETEVCHGGEKNTFPKVDHFDEMDEMDEISYSGLIQMKTRFESFVIKKL